MVSIPLFPIISVLSVETFYLDKVTLSIDIMYITNKSTRIKRERTHNKHLCTLQSVNNVFIAQEPTNPL